MRRAVDAQIHVLFENLAKLGIQQLTEWLLFSSIDPLLFSRNVVIPFWSATQDKKSVKRDVRFTQLPRTLLEKTAISAYWGAVC